MLVIGDAVFGRHLLDDPTDRRVVDAAHLGEKVVLDLEIQSTDVPAEQPVGAREVGGGLHFVHEPRIFHGLLLLGCELHRPLNDVRELKHEAQDQTRRDVHRQEADEELPPRHIEDQQRNHNHEGVVDRLHDQEFGDFALGVHDVAVGAEVASRQVLKVLEEDPEQRGQAVNRNKIEMLVSVHWAIFGGR